MEHAKQESESHPTQKRRQYNTEIQRWEAGAFDTATWLYNLVFVADLAQNSPPEAWSSAGRQASVTDSHSDDERGGNCPSAGGARRPDASNRALIVWNKNTEPRFVVDRLLMVWTELSDEQIRASATGDLDDAWSKSLMDSIQNGEAEDTKDGRRGEKEENEDEDDDDDDDDDRDEAEAEAEEEAEVPAEFWDMHTQSSEESSILSTTLPSIPGRTPIGGSIDSAETPLPPRNLSRSPPPPPPTGYAPDDHPRRRVHFSDRAYAESIGDSTFDGTLHDVRRSGHGYIPSGKEPLPDTWPYRPEPNYSTTQSARRQPSNAPHYFPQPSDNCSVFSEPGTRSRRFRDPWRFVDDPFEDPVDFYSTAHSKTRQPLGAPSGATHSPNPFAARTSRPKRFEGNEAPAEKPVDLAAFADTLDYFIRVRANRESAKADAAKRQKVAEADANDRETKIGEQKAMSVQDTRLGDEYKKRVQQWEDSFAALDKDRKDVLEILKDSRGAVPKRRTSIWRGDHRIEVAEYTTEKMEPFPTFHANLLDPNSIQRADCGQSGPDGPAQGICSTSKAPQNSSKAFAVPLAQPTLHFSPHLGRSCIKTCELQLSLSKNGIKAEFDDLSEGNWSATTKPYDQREGFVRSTISWEHPVFVMGSELLRTLRGVGWKPLYFRGSGECLESFRR